MRPSEKFQQNFPADVRQDGEILRDQATRLWGGDDRISCDFPDGTTAKLEVAAHLLVSSCSCALFAQGKPCPHLWATLRMADWHEDLSIALKKNCPRKISLASISSLGGENQLVYEKNKSTPRTLRPKIQKDEDGRLLEYSPTDIPRLTHSRPALPCPPVDPTLPQEILYVVRPDHQGADGTICPIETWWRPRTQPGQPTGACRPFRWEKGTAVATSVDSRLTVLLVPWRAEPPARPNLYLVPITCGDVFVALMEASPRLRWADSREGNIRLHPLDYPLRLPLEFQVKATLNAEALFVFAPWLGNQDKELPWSEVRMLVTPPSSNESPRINGLLLAENQLLPVHWKRADDLARQFLSSPTLTLDYGAALTLVSAIVKDTDLNIDHFPEAIRFHAQELAPQGQLFIRTARFKFQDKEQLHAELSFQYGTITVPEDSKDTRLTDGRTLIIRDEPAEQRLKERLLSLGFRFNTKAYQEELGWKLLPAKLDEAVLDLVSEGWMVQAEGKTYRRPVTKQASISSGMDWFEVKGNIEFDGQPAPLPALLAAVKNRQHAVRLDDGTYGLLPREWLENFTVLTELGEVTNDRIRFRVEQAALVNAILNDRLAQSDSTLRERLVAFDRLATPAPAHAPDGFQATLRPYQEIGVGWLLAMQIAGLGACLADDMGLGKTIQVLAVLASRAREPAHRPSLLVMPRSLIFNWQTEARRFAPWLRTRLHLGSSRDLSPQALADTDLLFTTYGTLRNDATILAKIDFDYCVLDESQIIKNADSSTAKAARCIQARHRIAMTGTPVENHLGELFSQLDFLNPGLFGRRHFNLAPSLDNPREDSALNRIRRAVRPFLLRRTKQEVAKELPPKTEQVLWCEMDEGEQAQYDELKRHYQQEILGRDAQASGMQTLAALMRLRQAACHPGLLRPERMNDSSAKLDLLCDNLATVLEAGHKALVFSQFTALLHIIQNRLNTLGYGQCYLDGQTQDRASEVQSFQEDPEKRVFLISLKAGGVGLNLTAASYVYIVDPWWNPAAESQAIDRAYRIGQTQAVTAYRLITKNTIEEKVHSLQNTKRALADAIVANTDTPTRLSRADLESLLE